MPMAVEQDTQAQFDIKCKAFHVDCHTGKCHSGGLVRFVFLYIFNSPNSFCLFTFRLIFLLFSEGMVKICAHRTPVAVL